MTNEHHELELKITEGSSETNEVSEDEQHEEKLKKTKGPSETNEVSEDEQREKKVESTEGSSDTSKVSQDVQHEEKLKMTKGSSETNQVSGDEQHEKELQITEDSSDQVCHNEDTEKESKITKGSNETNKDVRHENEIKVTESSDEQNESLNESEGTSNVTQIGEINPDSQNKSNILDRKRAVVQDQGIPALKKLKASSAICHNCGESGHKKSRCPNKQSVKDGNIQQCDTGSVINHTVTVTVNQCATENGNDAKSEDTTNSKIEEEHHELERKITEASSETNEVFEDEQREKKVESTEGSSDTNKVSQDVQHEEKLKKTKGPSETNEVSEDEQREKKVESTEGSSDTSKVSQDVQHEEKLKMTKGSSETNQVSGDEQHEKELQITKDSSDQVSHNEDTEKESKITKGSNETNKDVRHENEIKVTESSDEQNESLNESEGTSNVTQIGEINPDSQNKSNILDRKRAVVQDQGIPALKKLKASSAICHNCGESGHKKSRCPNKQSVKDGNIQQCDTGSVINHTVTVTVNQCATENGNDAKSEDTTNSKIEDEHHELELKITEGSSETNEVFEDEQREKKVESTEGSSDTNKVSQEVQHEEKLKKTKGPSETNEVSEDEQREKKVESTEGSSDTSKVSQDVQHEEKLKMTKGSSETNQVSGDEQHEKELQITEDSSDQVSHKEDTEKESKITKGSNETNKDVRHENEIKVTESSDEQNESLNESEGTSNVTQIGEINPDSQNKSNILDRKRAVVQDQGIPALKKLKASSAICHNCGESGHKKFRCPNKQSVKDGNIQQCDTGSVIDHTVTVNQCATENVNDPKSEDITDSKTGGSQPEPSSSSTFLVLQNLRNMLDRKRAVVEDQAIPALKKLKASSAICHNCGESGHKRFRCPNKQSVKDGNIQQCDTGSVIDHTVTVNQCATENGNDAKSGDITDSKTEANFTESQPEPSSSSTFLVLQNFPKFWNVKDVSQFLTENINCDAILADMQKVVMLKSNKAHARWRVEFASENSCLEARKKLNGITPEGGRKFNYCQGKVKFEEQGEDKITVNKFIETRTSGFPHHAFPMAQILLLENQSREETYGLNKHFLDHLEIRLPLTSKIFVKELDTQVTEEKLREVFEIAGHVVSVTIKPDELSPTAIIEFKHPIEAVQAIAMFHNQILFGKKMKVGQDMFTNKSPILPEGLSGVGRGLGVSGKPLRYIWNVMEVGRLKKEIIDLRNELRTTKQKFSQYDNIKKSQNAPLPAKQMKFKPAINTSTPKQQFDQPLFLRPHEGNQMNKPQNQINLPQNQMNVPKWEENPINIPQNQMFPQNQMNMPLPNQINMPMAQQMNMPMANQINMPEFQMNVPYMNMVPIEAVPAPNPMSFPPHQMQMHLYQPNLSHGPMDVMQQYPQNQYVMTMPQTQVNVPPTQVNVPPNPVNVPHNQVNVPQNQAPEKKIVIPEKPDNKPSLSWSNIPVNQSLSLPKIKLPDKLLSQTTKQKERSPIQPKAVSQSNIVSQTKVSRTKIDSELSKESKECNQIRAVKQFMATLRSTERESVEHDKQPVKKSLPRYSSSSDDDDDDEDSPEYVKKHRSPSASRDSRRYNDSRSSRRDYSRNSKDNTSRRSDRTSAEKSASTSRRSDRTSAEKSASTSRRSDWTSAEKSATTSRRSDRKSAEKSASTSRRSDRKSAEKSASTSRRSDQTSAEKSASTSRRSDRILLRDGIEPSNILYFRNLPRTVTLNALKSKMSELGELQYVGEVNGGRAIIQFKDKRDAERCIKIYDGSKVDGLPISVEYYY